MQIQALLRSLLTWRISWRVPVKIDSADPITKTLEFENGLFLNHFQDTPSAICTYPAGAALELLSQKASGKQSAPSHCPG